MTIKLTTYECVICHNVNHVSKVHCSTCGTIPAMYSVNRKPSKELLTNDVSHAINGFIEVVNSINVERTERRCYARVNLRTVPADYYASGE